MPIADGAGNDNTQTSQVDNFVTQGVDLLLISPFEAARLAPAVARAVKAGIPVIELDRQTNGTPGKDYTAFVRGDNYKIAFEAGVCTAKTFKANASPFVRLRSQWRPARPPVLKSSSCSSSTQRRRLLAAPARAPHTACCSRHRNSSSPHE